MTLTVGFRNFMQVHIFLPINSFSMLLKLKRINSSIFNSFGNDVNLYCIGLLTNEYFMRLWRIFLLRACLTRLVHVIVF